MQHKPLLVQFLVYFDGYFTFFTNCCVFLFDNGYIIDIRIS